MNRWEQEPEFFPSRAEVLSSPELQLIEKEACRRDPLRFLLRWVFTTDEVRENAIRRFPWKPHVAYFVDTVWKKEKNILVPKSRRMLVTWTVVALHVHEALFIPHRNHFFQSKREEDAVSHVEEKAKFIVEHLPEFLQLPVKFKSRPCSLTFSNGSKIRGIPGGGDKIRQHTASSIFVDEGAFIDELEETITASKPCLEGGGRLIIVSSLTPSYFADLVDDEKEEDING